MQVLFLGQEDPLGEEVATHSSILAWRTPWTEDPGGLQSTGLQRVRHNLVTEHCTNHKQVLLFSIYLFSLEANYCTIVVVFAIH